MTPSSSSFYPFVDVLFASFYLCSSSLGMDDVSQVNSVGKMVIGQLLLVDAIGQLLLVDAFSLL